MSAQPIGPDPGEVLHVVPDVPGRPVPPDAVAIPVAEYERLRRRVIAAQIRRDTDQITSGDFTGFTEVTEAEQAAGELDA